MNMLIDFKKFHIKILVHMKKTYDVTIDHMVHFVGSKLGLYVSFLIPLYIRARPDWAYEFPDPTGPDPQFCRTGPAGPD